MPKRLALRLVNLLWYTTALLIVLAAVLVSVGREMLPQISLQNERLLQLLSERSGASIRASNLHVQWTRLYPEFSASTLDISTPAMSVQLEQITMELDILQSLLLRTPVVDRLYVGDVHARIAAVSDPASPADLDKTWQLLNKLLNKNIQVQHLQLDWAMADRQGTLRIADARIDQQFGRKKVFLRLLDAEDSETLQVIGQLQGDTLRDSQGQLYAKAENLPLRDWVPARQTDQLGQTWQADGEAWLSWEGTGQASLTTHLDIHQHGKADRPLPDAINTALSAQWQHGEWQLDIHSLAARLGELEQPLLDNARLTFQPATPAQWRLQLQALPLERLQTLQHYLPDGTLRQLLVALHPAGTLENIDLRWDNSQPLPERMALRANASDLSSGAWRGVPAFTGVSGYLQSGIGYGFIDLDSRNGFSMFYPEVYKTPLLFRTAAGRVQWHWQPEQHAVLVGSDYAALDGEMGQARGSFWLHLPLPGADFHDEMFLAIGLRNSEAKHRNALLPFTLPPHLLEWLDTNINSGQVPEAGFFYRGALSGHEPASRAVQFVANIRNADLTFDPAWPGLAGVDASLLVDDSTTSVQASRGRMLDTAIEDTLVTVTPQEHGVMLGIRGTARGPAADGLKILRDTPLKSTIGTAMDTWQMPKGQLTAGLSLQLPLGGAPGTPQEDVRVALFNTDLAMDDLKLSFKETSGDLRYQTAQGLSATRLDTTLFGQPLAVNINSERKGKALSIRVNGSGSAGASELANWSRLHPLQLVKGRIDYQAALTLGPFGTATPSPTVAQLQLTSDLRQVALPLPAPYGKAVGERKPFSLAVDLYRDNRQDYRFNLDQRLNGAVSLRNGHWHSGEVVLDGTAAIADIAGPLLIHGTLTDTEVQPWLDLIAAYNTLPADPAASSTDYPQVSFRVGNARWKDNTFANLQLTASHADDSWQVYFDSSNARGSAFFHDDGSPPDIRLSQFRHDSQPDNDASAALASLRFEDVPSLNLLVDHLVINGMDIGHLSTSLDSRPDALHFRNIRAEGPGYRLHDASGKQGATLVWRRNPDGSEQTEAHGLLHMAGEQPALAHLGIDPFVRGEKIQLLADLTWPGSPADASLTQVNGLLYTEGSKGKYLQANTNAAMRALGFINVATWARRLRLDFSDLTSDGISFDEYKGKLRFDHGVMSFAEPLRIESPSSALAMDGKAMLKEETLDLELTATLPVSNNAAWITALAGGLPAAAGVYLVSKVFDRQIQTLTSLSYRITGPMHDPVVSFDRLAPPRKTEKPAAAAQ